MFYSKYRPKKFSDLVGLEPLSKAILTALSADKLAHAYFFYGPRGTGKTTVARLIAKALNCENMHAESMKYAGPLSKPRDAQPPFSQGTRGLYRGLKTNPNEKAIGTASASVASAAADTRLATGQMDVCGECSNCKAIEEGRFLDLIEIDAASNRGIDDIRALRDKVNLAPTHKKAKVYIIDEVHMLTIEAFNALLKTLEEPPRRVYFVLCTTDPQKVPDTIKSRCAKFEFRRASEAAIVRKLERIIEEEAAASGASGYKIEREDLKKIAKASIGGFRDAETLLEQVLIGGETVDEVVSGGGELSVDDFVDSLKKNASEALVIISKVANSGVDLTAWGLELLSFLRKLLLLKAGIPDADLDASEDKIKDMKEQAGVFSLPQMASLLDIFSDAVNKTKDSALPTLPLEVAVVKWFGDDCSGDSAGPSSKPRNAQPPFSQEAPAGPVIGPACAGRSSHKVLPDRPVLSGTPSAADTRSAPVSDYEDDNKRRPQGNLQWEELLSAVRPYNHSVEALLRSCRMVSFDGDLLHIEAFYSFHKERLESPKNRETVESTLEKLLGKAVRLKCTLGKKLPVKEDLTDKNISEPQKEAVEEVAKNVLEVFDGGIEV